MNRHLIKFLIILITLITFNIRSTEVNNKYRKIAIEWAEDLKCENQSAKEIQIKALEELLLIFYDPDTNSDKLSKYSKKCIDIIKNIKLLHPVRVFARINLANNQKFLAFQCYSDYAIDSHLTQARKNFVISLAMARKSGSFRQSQEELVHRVYNEYEFRNLKNFYKPISTEEVDKMEKELSETDYLTI